MLGMVALEHRSERRLSRSGRGGWQVLRFWYGAAAWCAAAVAVLCLAFTRASRSGGRVAGRACGRNRQLIVCFWPKAAVAPFAQELQHFAFTASTRTRGGPRFLEAGKRL